MQGRSATDPGVEGLNPGRVNQIYPVVEGSNPSRVKQTKTYMDAFAGT